MHKARILVGPQRFISGSVVLSPNRRFASPSKRTADSQTFWRLSNTDAPVYVHRWAISPALRWHSSEREKKLSDRLVASSFFQNFQPVDLRSPTDLSHYPDRSNWPIFDRSHVPGLHDAPGEQRNDRQWWIARFPRLAHFNACEDKIHLEKEQVHQSVRMICDGLAKLLAPRWERFSVDLLDPRQSIHSGFHSDEGRTWLMHLCISTDPSGSTAL